MAGRVAPFIELGVGFNPELTARENVILNGVMMGLSREQAEGRLDAVIEFAELEEFVDLKLKNYSSGMLVRLAFSVMIQSDAEILLDRRGARGRRRLLPAEVQGRLSRDPRLRSHRRPRHPRHERGRAVLPPGDAARPRRRSHAIGDPDEVARRYLRLNFATPTGASARTRTRRPRGRRGAAARRLAGGRRRADDQRRAGRPSSTFHADLRGPTAIRGPDFGFVVANADGVEVGGFGRAQPTTDRAVTCSRPASGAGRAPRSTTGSLPGRYVRPVLGAPQPQLRRAVARPRRTSSTSSSSGPDHGRAGHDRRAVAELEAEAGSRTTSDERGARGPRAARRPRARRRSAAAARASSSCSG